MLLLFITLINLGPLFKIVNPKCSILLSYFIFFVELITISMLYILLI